MFKKAVSILMILPAILALVACSSLQLPGAASSSSQAQSSQQQAQGQALNMANQPLEGKLAMGTLKLEGTAQAVTADEAKALLPLWKAAKSLNASSTASSSEVTALYQQIQEAMTAEQIQTIKDLSLSQTDLQALMKQYNVTAPQPGNFPTLSADQQATRQARRSASGNSSTGGANAGGPPADFGGGMPPDGGGFPGGAGGTGSSGTGTNGQPSAQGTPVLGQGNRGPGGGWMNNMFIDPLIKVLEDRAGVTSGS